MNSFFDITKIKCIKDTQEFLLSYSMCDKCGGEVKKYIVKEKDDEVFLLTAQCKLCKTIYILKRGE